jgi:hypothetical protein
LLRKGTKEDDDAFIPKSLAKSPVN